ncbi:hypothetical protein AB1L30_26330 [Bremerella sp. JC817]|uniref:Flp family type IVb pilin n=1 Tax=Bremerella sp. JC817 TaxID=3231756 RepID=UPI0034580F67
MLNVMKKLWNDERGFVNSTELILIATLAVLGLIVGLASLRDSVVQELGDSAAAVGQVNQSYSVFVDSNGAVSGPIITAAGANGFVTVERDFTINGQPGVSVTSRFRNYQYTDRRDIGDGQDTAGNPPPTIVSIGPDAQEEGEALGGP